MLKKIVLGLLAVGGLIQLVPFGRQHTNPPVIQEPAWDSPQTRDLVKRACFDCHSNQTVWPWYSNVAPVSWLVQRDVNGGRRHLYFIPGGHPPRDAPALPRPRDHPQRHATHVAAEVKQGDMPPWFYLPMHSAAKLTAPEKDALIDGAEK